MTKLPLLLLLAAASIAVAEIKTLTINSDTRPMILFEKFGFTHTGHVNISVSRVAVEFAATNATADPSRLGFVLLSGESVVQALEEIEQDPHFCVLDPRYAFHLFSFRELSSSASFSRSYPVPAPNEYSICFANCAPAPTAVTMAVRTELFNLRGDSQEFLSYGLTPLTLLYVCFSVTYFIFLGYWIYLCVTNKTWVLRIHLLMTGLLLMKALNLICDAENKHYVKVTGTPHGWDVMFYIVQLIRTALLFTVIGLIGTGWSFLKPSLQEKEKALLIIVIELQVLANVALVLIDKAAPFTYDWLAWNNIFLIADIICCMAIGIPVVWSVESLRGTSKTDGKAARNLAKLKLFQKFYLVVMGYLYFTRVVVLGIKTIAAYRFQWVSYFAEEGASLAFYFVIFFNMFRPVERNEYVVLDEKEEEAAELALTLREVKQFKFSDLLP